MNIVLCSTPHQQKFDPRDNINIVLTSKPHLQKFDLIHTSSMNVPPPHLHAGTQVAYNNMSSVLHG